jgi:hypothetical protein
MTSNASRLTTVEDSYATTSYVDGAVVTSSAISLLIDTALTGYATTSELSATTQNLTDLSDEGNLTESQPAVLICDTFRLKRMCTFSQKIARSGAVHRRGNHGPMGPMLDGCPLCVARKWVPRRARGEGRARPPPLQHPTPPRRRRRPRPNSRYQRHPRSVRGGVARRPAPNPSPRAEMVVSHSRASAAPSPVATPRSTSPRRRRPPLSRSSDCGPLWIAWTRMA